MNTKGKYHIEKLLFRRQFILGPHFVEEFPSWKRVKVRDMICLTAHTDLPVYQAVSGNKSLTLLGYILDPNNSRASDADITNDLLRELCNYSSLDSFFECTYGFGGRWILVVDDSKEIRLFHDPMGLRQVFYTNACFPKALWCASQPGIIAELLKLEMDNEAVNGYINTNVYRSIRNVLWPADTSPYKEITHLLPNHYLDLTTGLRHRYWPDRKLERLSMEEAVEENSKMLTDLIKSAFNRFSLAFTITAGWDSRLLLAASREISTKIYYFTLFRKDRENDVIVPSRLLSKLGLKHNIIKYPQYMDNEFGKIYKRNVTEAHNLWGIMAQGVYNHYPQDRVCVKGNASEIARVRLRLPEGEKVTAEKLAKFSSLVHTDEMSKNLYVIKSWEKWLSGIGEIYNFHILDLFYWEHWGGNFAAMAQAEWDIVQEVFTPYNCRRFLINMLSVDEKFRDHDLPILYRELIMKLWPEVLSEPVNPPSSEGIMLYMKKRLKNLLSHGKI